MQKKTIAVVAVTVLIIGAVAVAAFARGGRHGFGWYLGHGAGGFGHRSEMMLERVAHRLDLSKAQREHVFAVLDDTRPAMREIRFAFTDHRRTFSQLNPADADYQARIKEIADEAGKLASQTVVLLGEMRAKVTTLLTEEQRKQLQQMLQEHRNHPLERAQ
jgi:Spy/CpxP family protein refolding chaperone